MVCLVHVPTQGGLVNPAVEVGRLCREAGVLFVLDACQSVGQLPLDVARARLRRVLAGNGRKFLRGPAAPGSSTCTRSSIARVEPVMLDLHAATWTAPGSYEVRDDARRFEMWESDVAAPHRARGRGRPRARLGHRRHRRAQRRCSPPGSALGWRTSPA